MAIAMAQAGGLGVIHKNMEPLAQANEVRKVKRFESGMVVNPITIRPDQPLSDALRIMQAEDRKSVVWGKSVSVRVDLGGRRIIKKKIINKEITKKQIEIK